MRNYGKVHTSFWTSETICGLSDDAKLLAAYLLTCPHSTIAGVFRLPVGYVCEDLQWNDARVSEGLHELLRNRFIRRCEVTSWTWVVKYLEWNKLENKNQRIGAVKIVNQIPKNCSWGIDYIIKNADWIGPDCEALEKGFKRVPKAFRIQEQEQEQEQLRNTKEITTTKGNQKENNSSHSKCPAPGEPGTGKIKCPDDFYPNDKTRDYYLEVVRQVNPGITQGQFEPILKIVIRDFIAYWANRKDKRKDWNLTFRKNPVAESKARQLAMATRTGGLPNDGRKQSAVDRVRAANAENLGMDEDERQPIDITPTVHREDNI